jgi:hypothetical protein
MFQCSKNYLAASYQFIFQKYKELKIKIIRACCCVHSGMYDFFWNIWNMWNIKDLRWNMKVIFGTCGTW